MGDRQTGTTKNTIKKPAAQELRVRVDDESLGKFSESDSQAADSSKLRGNPAQLACTPGGNEVVDFFLELADLIGKAWVGFAAVLDGFDRVHDGGVVASAEVAADFFEAEAGVLARKPHADLPRFGDGFVALAALQVLNLDLVVVGDDADDVLEGDVIAAAALGGVAGDLFGHGQVDGPVEQGGVHLQGVELAF